MHGRRFRPVQLTPHRLNTDFAWRSPEGPFKRVSATNLKAWDEVGAFVLEDVLDLGDLAELTAAIDPLEDEMTELLRTQPGGRIFIADADAITFTVHIVRTSAAARAFVAQPLMAELASDLIGPDVRLYWDQAVYKKPEPVREFPWHQDNGYNFVEPQQYLTCWVPLVDATIENGCPWVVPGLHRLGTLEHWWTDSGWQCVEAPANAIPVEAKAGSIVVFSSLTPHRTGPNLSDDVRKAYIVQYAPDGAESIRHDGAGSIVRQGHSDPDRQFFVVTNGRVTGPPPG
jgi:ectoine hydroxylase-related dioxygenase (phytanoyl-CoA dioxygenase family)